MEKFNSFREISDYAHTLLHDNNYTFIREIPAEEIIHLFVASERYIQDAYNKYTLFTATLSHPLFYFTPNILKVKCRSYWPSNLTTVILIETLIFSSWYLLGCSFDDLCLFFCQMMYLIEYHEVFDQGRFKSKYILTIKKYIVYMIKKLIKQLQISYVYLMRQCIQMK